jgi:hypothetical protein
VNVPQKHVITIAESLAAGSAVGYGARLLAEVDLIVSIVAGVLVAVSAGVSIYMNLKRRQEEKKNSA